MLGLMERFHRKSISDMANLVRFAYHRALGYDGEMTNAHFSNSEERFFTATGALAAGSSYDKPSEFFDILADAAMFAASTLKKENL